MPAFLEFVTTVRRTLRPILIAFLSAAWGRIVTWRAEEDEPSGGLMLPDDRGPRALPRDVRRRWFHRDRIAFCYSLGASMTITWRAALEATRSDPAMRGCVEEFAAVMAAVPESDEASDDPFASGGGRGHRFVEHVVELQRLIGVIGSSRGRDDIVRYILGELLPAGNIIGGLTLLADVFAGGKPKRAVRMLLNGTRFIRDWASLAPGTFILVREATMEELNLGLNHESFKPVHLGTDDAEIVLTEAAIREVRRLPRRADPARYRYRLTCPALQVRAGDSGADAVSDSLAWASEIYLGHRAKMTER